MSSFEQVKGVQKKLVKERDDSTSALIPVMKEDNRKFSLFPHPRSGRGESGAHIAAAIQQPVVEHEEERGWEIMGASAIPPPPSEGSPSSKGTGVLRNRAVLLRKGGSSEA